jgi:hypothetical protein
VRPIRPTLRKTRNRERRGWEEETDIKKVLATDGAQMDTDGRKW